jgi:hypothetical protein
MATSTELVQDSTGGCSADAVLPVGPFVSNNYHFGMLLGVTDLDTDQGYHRGKGWLHQSWLHGAGVSWGLGVAVRPDHREITVQPGLATTAAGREAYLDREYCVDIGAWFAAHAPDDLVVEHRPDGTASFTVHVVIAPRGCLDRPVPAITEPCAGAQTDTAYSRVVETAQLDIRANAAPPRATRYPKVRQFLGLLPVDDDEIANARLAVATADVAHRDAVRLEALRKFAADDVTALAPPTPLATPFAADPDDAVVLAEARVILVDAGGSTGGHITDTGPDATEVDNRVRPAHVATSTLTDLLAGSNDLVAGTQLDPATLTLTDTQLTVAATGGLVPGTVTADTVALHAFDGAVWVAITPSAIALHGDGVTIEIGLAAPITDRPVRLVVTGTGPTPVLDIGLSPLAGTVGTVPNPPDTGTDAVLMVRS